MKFMHLADVHLDMVYTSLRRNSELLKSRKIEHLHALKEAFDLAKAENVDFLFISGDLFEQQYVQNETIEYIVSCFKCIENIPIFIAPGNHDPLIKNSLYNTFKWPDNVHIFTGEISKISFEDVDMYGIGFENYEMDSDALDGFKVDDINKINVLITHGTLNGASHKYHDIKEKWLGQFDYVALGHIHEKKVDDSRIIYPGSLVGGGFDELGGRGVVIGNLTKENCELEFRNIEERNFEIVEFNITGLKSAKEVTDKLNLKNNLYRIILTGAREVGINDIEEVLNTVNGNICEIIDNTTLPYDFQEIAKQNNIKGVFTKNILQILDDSNKEEVMMAIEEVYKNL